MSSLISLILHPLVTLNLAEDDGQGIDVFYLLTLFFALGIWLVFNRYQNARNSPIYFEYTAPDAAEPSWGSRCIENPHLNSHKDSNEFAPALKAPGRDYITCFDPATGFHIQTIIADNEEEIRRKIDRARTAQKKWRKKTFTERRRVIRSLLKWLVDNKEVCARVACRDTGKTLIDAALGEILVTCSKMEWLISHGERALRPENRSTNLVLLHKKAQVHYDPLGVVAALVSWNYPLHNAWSPILSAIFAGNGIVLKCSEHVVWSSSWFVGAIQECLKACGHDPELVQLVTCWPGQAEALTTSPDIKHITFIGSETVGRKVAVAATKNLTPVTLELGGKDPAIILPNTDLQKWISVWMRGVYQNAGQNCIGIERIIVHGTQYDELYEMILERVQKMRLGSVLRKSAEGYISTVDCGSMISRERFEAIEQLIAEAKDNGAQCHGGEQWEHLLNENGAYFSATVVGQVTSSMSIAQQELFAPVALLMQYDEINEAIDIANETKYGLGASVFGPDQEQCIEVAKKLDCGMVAVNDFGVFYVNQDLPFGGTKASGYGRFGGPEGLRALTNPKAIIVDRWPWLITTSIPQVLDYPLVSLEKSWDFVNGLLDFLYADQRRARINGLIRLMRAK